MGRKANKEPREWASIKLHRPLVAWLKVEAAIRGIYMGDLVDELLKQALGGAPWKPRQDGRGAPARRGHRQP
jgi:hypothetical protein